MLQMIYRLGHAVSSTGGLKLTKDRDRHLGEMKEVWSSIVVLIYITDMLLCFRQQITADAIYHIQFSMRQQYCSWAQWIYKAHRERKLIIPREACPTKIVITYSVFIEDHCCTQSWIHVVSNCIAPEREPPARSSARCASFL